jgi:methyl coenzyme M reductase subunit C
MATATVKLKEIVQPIESVTIVINQDELDTLITILNRIGGCPDKSPRKHSANILMALVDATKQTRGNSTLYELGQLISDAGGKYGAIYFDDYPEEE